MDPCTYLVPPSPVCLIVLSVRMVFELRSTAGILCNTRRLVKHNWLIYWVSGPEVGGILEAPWRSHHGIIQRGQRAHSRNNRGEISRSWVQCLFFFFFFSCQLCWLCEMFPTWGGCLFLPLHFDSASKMFRDNPVYVCLYRHLEDECYRHCYLQPVRIFLYMNVNILQSMMCH